MNERLTAMQYKTETHMHTAESSGCGMLSAAEIVGLYRDKGYSTLFITDHFFNGNSAVPRGLPWRERVMRYALGWQNAVTECEKYGMTALFGVEFTYRGMDFLTYGADAQWFAAHPEIMSMDASQYLAFVRSQGGFVVQAHPFREADYIKEIVVYPKEVDAFEVYNAKNPEKRMNDAALEMAREYGLCMTAGSDAHCAEDIKSGIITGKRILSAADYAEALRSGRVSLIY